MDLEKLKFPIGEFHFTKDYSQNDIVLFPSLLKKTLDKPSNEQKNWKYRPGGWTIKQVVHHCSDSHMNSFIRFKLALTEEKPAIRPYYEDKWAELSDSLENDLTDSLNLITGLHNKWGRFLKNIPFGELTKLFIHPEHGTEISLAENIAFYSWHGKHHLQHIKQALAAKGSYN